ncbi:MAG: PspC domain-containing protein [Rikenellaceae bacterium]|nr:PspC domain-containing protein [Rikenellaceae bacterium]
MRETIDISINGIAFKAEYDAYEILKDYFDRLRNACSVEGDEGKEIADDIEARASELILSRQSSVDMPVDRECAQWVIEQLGGIDQIPLSDNRTDERTKDYTSYRTDKIGDIPKRFYRSKEGARMGGVFSGLGLYFNVDPSVLRLSFAVMMLVMLFFCRYWGFFSGAFFFSILLYIMTWILVPVAATPRQKLELEGQPVTPVTVRRSFRRGQNTGAGTEADNTAITRGIYILGKIILFIVYVPVIIISIGLAIGMIAVLAGGFGSLIYFHDTLSVFVDAPVYLLGIISIISALAPMGLLLYMFISILTTKAMRSYIVVPLIAIWVVCWVLLGIFGIKERMRYIHRSDVEKTFSLAQPSGDTLYVRSIVDPDVSYEYSDGDGLPVFTGINGYVSDDNDYSLKIKLRSYGRNDMEASKLADQIGLKIFQRGDTVFVDYGQYYTMPGSFRGQKARLRIGAPEGGQIMIDGYLRQNNLAYGRSDDGMYSIIRHKEKDNASADNNFADKREIIEIGKE